MPSINCKYCGCDNHITVDHIIPRSWIGDHNNVQYLCWPHHWAKRRFEIKLEKLIRKDKIDLITACRLLRKNWNKIIENNTYPLISCFCGNCLRERRAYGNL